MPMKKRSSRNFMQSPPPKSKSRRTGPIPVSLKEARKTIEAGLSPWQTPENDFRCWLQDEESVHAFLKDIDLPEMLIKNNVCEERFTVLSLPFLVSSSVVIMRTRCPSLVIIKRPRITRSRHSFLLILSRDLCGLRIFYLSMLRRAFEGALLLSRSDISLAN